MTMLCALATPDDHPEDILARVASLVELVEDYADKLSIQPPGMEADRRSLEGLTLVCRLVREAMAQAVANQRRRMPPQRLEQALNSTRR